MTAPFWVIFDKFWSFFQNISVRTGPGPSVEPYWEKSRAWKAYYQAETDV
jgi:hypothetical protein